MYMKVNDSSQNYNQDIVKSIKFLNQPLNDDVRSILFYSSKEKVFREVSDSN